MARIASLSVSADGSAWTDLWECTAGSFHWHYEINETVQILEGGAIVTDRDGVVWDLKPGHVIRFLVGTKAHWRIPSYVRKVAFCSEPLPPSIFTLLRARNWLRRSAGRLMGRTVKT
ncbi:cupin domain-containing protein [Vineibacter terrae]|uniref:cupin domain-containing protein n=1 Tax=Vineibacter terrae TaxID=2586908 RepID=UPI0015B56660|nr:cupin domain-containing protein [Vineibacter terrae]